MRGIMGTILPAIIMSRGESTLHVKKPEADAGGVASGKPVSAGEAVELIDNKDGTFTHPFSGEVTDDKGNPIIVDQAMFGDARDAAKQVNDGGVTIKKVGLKAGQSIYGVFLGYIGYNYTDKRTKNEKGEVIPRQVVLSDLMLDVLHPTTGKSMGIVVKVGSTTRIMQDMALAQPGDKVRISRLGEVQISGNRMWDDIVRIYRSDLKRPLLALSATPITDQKALDAHKAGANRLLPGAGETAVERTSDDDVMDKAAPAV